MMSTIWTCIETKQLKSKHTQDTADFIDMMNKLFDYLNSRILISSNPYNCALSDNGDVKQFLLNCSYFKNLQKCKNGKLLSSLCFRGFTHTINGILYLFEEEKQNGISFLLTF